ncbi:MAG: hypothetical protein E7342_01620 [Clostridiales bacterium]|nr:hypothetical protein [Clostridiales bacterium]
MSLFFIIYGAILVSVDSFLCGFSLANMEYKKWQVVLGVFFPVLALCFITNYLGVFLQLYFTEDFSSIGGIILILVGLFSLLNIKKDKTHKKSILRIFISGFAVGLDGAFFNLSVSLMGISSFYVPLTIAFIHGAMVFLSVKFANTRLLSLTKRCYFLAPTLLILLGFYKLIFLLL